MNNVKVTCELKSYDDPAKPSIRVHSHWNVNSYVVLEVDGKKVTVVARHLKAAIENCENSG